MPRIRVSLVITVPRLISIALSARSCTDNRLRITPRHVQLAVRNDEELNVLLRNVTITEGGVQPHIEKALLAMPKGKKGRKSTGGGTSSVAGETYGELSLEGMPSRSLCRDPKKQRRQLTRSALRHTEVRKRS
jgi:hypothetical protein